MKSAWRDRLRPRLRTVLIAVNLLVLALPLAGIGIVRLYESELVQRTEAELIGQGALVAEVYAEAVAGAMAARSKAAKPGFERNNSAAGHAIAPHSSTFGARADPQFWSASAAKAAIAPRPTRLNRSSTEILPDTQPSTGAVGQPHPISVASGTGMGALLRRATRVTLSSIRIVGVNGFVVATSRGGFGKSVGHWAEVRRGLRGEPTSFLRQRRTSRTRPSLRSVSRGTPVRVFVGYPVIVRGRVWGVVVLSRTPLDVAKALYLNRHNLLSGALVLLFVGALVAFVTSRLLARPLLALRDQAATVAAGNRTVVNPIAHAGTQEVAELSAAIAQMSQTLHGRAAYLEAFSRNVSHAFKTPLTTIRGTIELLQDHLDDMTVEQRERFLSNLEGEAARLDRLVRRLMVLARADVLAPSDEATLVQPILVELQRRHGQVTSIAITCNTPELEVAISPEILDAMVDNLVENAVRHGGKAVHITTNQSDAAHVTIRVEDDGPGIDMDIRERLFEPFATTAGARGGTGLGLAIVRALARAHGGDVHLIETATGAAFAVSIPTTKRRGG